MLDRLTSLAAFTKTAETGSFTNAGASLGMSAQMVAKHVVGLENQLGGRLLARTTRQQRLTELGRAYYVRCKRILAEIEAADALAAQITLEPAGSLRISAPTVFGANGLVPLLTRYQDANPRIEIDLVLTDRVVDLVDEGFEAVFRVGPLKDSSLIARKLAPYRLTTAASPAYLARRGIPIEPSQLLRHDCLVYAQRSREPENSWIFQRDGLVYPVQVQCRFKSNEVAALLAMAIEGAGIVLAAEDALREALMSGRLVRVLPNYASPSREMHLLFPPDRHRTPKLRAFIEAATDYFKLRQSNG